MRAWKAQNRSHLNAYQRAWKAQNPDRPEQLARQRGRHQRYRAQNREQDNAYRLNRRHGFLTGDEKAVMWQAQGGRCYLCGHKMILGREHIDHDHSCCPKDRSCAVCRRGLACKECNVAIGHAGDDPERLRRMADALEAAKLAFSARKAASGPHRLPL
jgi:hypothetical protein